MNFYDVGSLKRGRRQMEKTTRPLVILGFGVFLICAYFAYRRQDGTFLLFGVLGMVLWNTAVIFIADKVAFERSRLEKMDDRQSE